MCKFFWKERIRRDGSIKKLKEKSRDVEKDLIVYDGEEEFRLEFKPNDVWFLFPEDGHMPGITIGRKQYSGKKIVLKLKYRKNK